jgi:hypothetical protein
MDNKKNTEQLTSPEALPKEEVSEVSHLNEGQTGFNPTPAELAKEFEGIKEQIKRLKK